MNKIKVVEYIGRIQDGGAETLVKDYALLLDKNKFDVTVVCNYAFNNSSNYKTLKENGVKVVQLFNGFVLINRIIIRILGSKYVSFFLKGAINEIKPNIIHTHLETLETLYYCKDSLDGIRLIYTCHNLPETLIGNILPKENKACEYLIKHNNLQIIALHDDMAKEINSMFNIDNTKVIKNAIDFNKFKNVKETKDEIKEKIGLPKDSYVVGSIGRLSYQKNPEFIIEVFNEVFKKKKNAYLLMVGHGNSLNKIQKMIKEYRIEDKVLLLSHRNDIPQLLKVMDVFLFPSRYEGLGIVLIEAQASGIHCVTSDKIPLEAYQSNLITRLSLNEDISKWVDACLNPKCNIDKYGDINNYDMNKEIKKLEKIYENNIG